MVAPARKALLLDRDGVINVDRGYVGRREDFEFVPGIFELVRSARNLGLLAIVITNQAGIARGLYSEEDYEALTRWMLAEFASRGAPLARVYHCPFHPTAGIGEYRRESFDRKPNPGMILRAREDFGLDLGRSVLVGDKDSDIAAGRAAGVGYNLLVSSGSASSRAATGLEFASLQAVGDWLARTFAAAE